MLLIFEYFLRKRLTLSNKRFFVLNEVGAGLEVCIALDSQAGIYLIGNLVNGATLSGRVTPG